MRRNPQKQWFAIAAALLLGLVLVASSSDRDDWPGRRQGGGSRGAFPGEVDHDS